MINRKQVLSLIVIVLICVGGIAAATVLSSSMYPSAKARAEVPTFQKSEVAIGTLQILGSRDFALVVARPSSDRFAIFNALRIRPPGGNHYVLYPGHIECRGFEMTSATIICDSYYRNDTLEWRFDGKPSSNAPEWLPDLDVMPYSILGDTVRYGAGA